jgi:hypothetical protein
MAHPFQPVSPQDGYAVTKSDTTVYPNAFSGLYVGTGGDVTVRTMRGTILTFADVPSGGYVLMAGDKVMSTGTGASDITALTY